MVSPFTQIHLNYNLCPDRYADFWQKLPNVFCFMLLGFMLSDETAQVMILLLSAINFFFISSHKRNPGIILMKTKWPYEGLIIEY